MSVQLWNGQITDRQKKQANWLDSFTIFVLANNVLQFGTNSLALSLSILFTLILLIFDKCSCDSKLWVWTNCCRHCQTIRISQTKLSFQASLPAIMPDPLQLWHYWSSVPFLCIWARVGLVAGRAEHAAEASEVENVPARWAREVDVWMAGPGRPQLSDAKQYARKCVSGSRTRSAWGRPAGDDDVGALSARPDAWWPTSTIATPRPLGHLRSESGGNHSTNRNWLGRRGRLG